MKVASRASFNQQRVFVIFVLLSANVSAEVQMDNCRNDEIFITNDVTSPLNITCTGLSPSDNVIWELQNDNHESTVDVAANCTFSNCTNSIANVQAMRGVGYSTLQIVQNHEKYLANKTRVKCNINSTTQPSCLLKSIDPTSGSVETTATTTATATATSLTTSEIVTQATSGETASGSVEITTATTATTTTTSQTSAIVLQTSGGEGQKSDGPPVGAIVGGTVGGAALVVIVVVIIVLVIKKRQSNAKTLVPSHEQREVDDLEEHINPAYGIENDLPVSEPSKHHHTAVRSGNVNENGMDNSGTAGYYQPVSEISPKRSARHDDSSSGTAGNYQPVNEIPPNRSTRPRSQTNSYPGADLYASVDLDTARLSDSGMGQLPSDYQEVGSNYAVIDDSGSSPTQSRTQPDRQGYAVVDKSLTQPDSDDYTVIGDSGSSPTQPDSEEYAVVDKSKKPGDQSHQDVYAFVDKSNAGPTSKPTPPMKPKPSAVGSVDQPGGNVEYNSLHFGRCTPPPHAERCSEILEPTYSHLNEPFDLSHPESSSQL